METERDLSLLESELLVHFALDFGCQVSSTAKFEDHPQHALLGHIEAPLELDYVGVTRSTLVAYNLVEAIFEVDGSYNRDLLYHYLFVVHAVPSREDGAESSQQKNRIVNELKFNSLRIPTLPR